MQAHSIIDLPLLRDHNILLSVTWTYAKLCYGGSPYKEKTVSSKVDTPTEKTEMDCFSKRCGILEQNRALAQRNKVHYIFAPIIWSLESTWGARIIRVRVVKRIMYLCNRCHAICLQNPVRRVKSAYSISKWVLKYILKILLVRAADQQVISHHHCYLKNN